MEEGKDGIHFYWPFFFFPGNVNFTVSAEALESQELCGTEEASVPQYGKKDTIIKPLLVEVSKPK